MILQQESKVKKRTPKFDLPRYLLDQTKDSLSELNIHATCEEYKCTREYALAHHDLLMTHYNEHGGTENYEKFRSLYESLCEYSESCRFGNVCELALMQTDYSKCPLRMMHENCRCVCKYACVSPPDNIIFPEEFACAI